MKIAQLVSPWLSVPPKGYGGTELIAHYITEGLVKKGHEVTLFASGDSQTLAKLHSVFPKALGNDGLLKAHPLNPMLHYIECFERAGEFDIIHNHAQYLAMFLAHLTKIPVIHTIHGSFTKEDVPDDDRRQTLSKFKNHNFTSISNSQRKGLPGLNYVATVYNGIDLSEFEYSEEKGNYLCWLGRVTAKKGPVDAIEAAESLGMELKIAGAIDPTDRPYFEKSVKPLIDKSTLVSFREEIKREEKGTLYKNALCTLYPIHWEEPFGLVMAESMACGTPVIAFNHGSVPEIIKDGVTGFIIDSDNEEREGKGGFIIKKQGVEGLVEATRRIKEIDRKACREHVEKNFTVNRMVDNYEGLYKEIIEKSIPSSSY